VPEDLIDKLKTWINTCDSPHEPCAVVHLKKGKIQIVPVNNISEDPTNYFVLDHNSFVQLSLTGEVLYIVHGHIDNCTPSDYDIKCCNSVNIPYIIFNRLTLEYTIVTPTTYKSLSGRVYEFGKNDCFEATRDWYKAHDIHISPRSSDWIDDWWLEGHDYMSEVIGVWPFTECTGLQYGDLLTFAVETDVENHIGVYIDRDCFFHHSVNRLSCKENLYPFWVKHLKKVYRYEGHSIKRIYWG